MVGARSLAVVAALGLWCAVARAAPDPGTSEVLRDGNTAALAGDWPRVASLVAPLLQRPLATPDLGEAHRLAGLAAFFQQLPGEAERHFLAYLRIELDGRLDPALHPPDVVAFFNDVASRHAAELRALRRKPRRSWLLTLLPPAGQFQNGERTKGYVLGATLGTALAVNIITYSYLRRWCNHTEGSRGGASTCDEDGGNHTRAARRLHSINQVSVIAVAVIYAYGVYDGVRGYRRRSREQALQPFISAARTDHVVVGIGGNF